MAKEEKKVEGTEVEKTSFVNKAMDGIVKGFNDVKDFTKRNGKKILTGVGVGTGIVVSAVLIDKFNIDPTSWFKKKDLGECDEAIEFEEPVETEE